MPKKLIVLLLIVTFFHSHANTSSEESEILALWDEEPCTPKGYDKPSTASQESWDAVQPYLLPLGHPVKKTLDLIFSQNRPLLSSKNMKKAGFYHYTPSDKSIIVSGHPRLKGYLIKTYLDTCCLPEWKLWIQRIVGANQVRESIDAWGYSSIMKAPKKWIYVLPANQPPPQGEGYYPKHYVLVVQDMGLLSDAANLQNWRHNVTGDFLNAFYNFVMINGLVDSYYIDNSPFCFDRKIAFVDTEHYNVDVIHFPGRQQVLFEYLSPNMRKQWEQLISGGLP
jgi:hypothetical protein